MKELEKLEFYKKIGQIVRGARLSAKLTMKQLGEKVGYSENGIWHFERGDREMSLNCFYEICKVLGLDANKVCEDASK